MNVKRFVFIMFMLYGVFIGAVIYGVGTHCNTYTQAHFEGPDTIVEECGEFDGPDVAAYVAFLAFGLGVSVTAMYSEEA